MGIALAVSILLRIAADPEADAALKTFAKAYNAQPLAIRSGAVVELARTQKPEVLAKLAELLTVDEPPIRIAAAKGLREFTENKQKAVAALMNGVGPNSKEFDVTAAILTALGTLGDEAALPTIHQHFASKAPKDKDYLVPKAAIRAAGLVRSRESIDPLIKLFKELEKAECLHQNGRSAQDLSGGSGVPGGAPNPQQERAKALIPVVLKALTAITKEKWPTAKEWEIWRERHLATFTVPK